MSQNKRRNARARRNEPKAKLPLIDRIKGGFSAFWALPTGQKASILGGIGAGLVLIVLMIVLVMPRPIALRMDENGDFVHVEKGITYRLAPLNYEPATWLTKTVYARGEGMDFYQIKGLSPDIWLCTVEEGDATVWCALDSELPGIAGFGVDEVIICTESTTVMAMNTIKKRAHAEAIVKDFEEGENVEIVPDAKRMRRLKFTSTTYRGLYYNLSYLETTEGNFLYDRETRKCVNVGTMLLWYINRSDMEMDENTLIGDEGTTKGEAEAPVGTDADESETA